MSRLLMFLPASAVFFFLAMLGLAHHGGHVTYTVTPRNPTAAATTTFAASPGSCDKNPCAYAWTAKVLRSPVGAGKARYVVITVLTSHSRRSRVLGNRRIFRYIFQSPGTYQVTLTVVDHSGHRSATLKRVVVSGLALPLDPNYVGPSYYSKFSAGPSTSMRYFPIYAYQMNLSQWNELPSRLTAAGVNGIDDAYDAPPDTSDYGVGQANGLHFNLMGTLPSRHASTVTSYAMLDEPNHTGSQYAAAACSQPAGGVYSAAQDTCAGQYLSDVAKYHAADPTRPVWGNFTKDVMEWAYPPDGWSDAQYAAHESRMINSLDIVSTDVYGWTDQYEWEQKGGNATGHYGAWVYGHAIERLNYYDPHIPAYGFIECCDSSEDPGSDGNGTQTPADEIMPGMIQAATWNLIVHGARGIIWWAYNWWDSSPGGDPYADPYPGATYTAPFAVFSEHQWDPQYAAIQQVDETIKDFAPEINSPTITGITATSSDGTPVATLGKDYGGKLWLLAEADGDTREPLSNTSPITATITLPRSVPAGTVLTVAGENRTVTVNAHHQFTDSFGTTTETPSFSGIPVTYGYAHHFYEMP